MVRPRYVKNVAENGGRYDVRVKPVLVESNEFDPFGSEIVTQYEEMLLRSQAAGVEIRALLFCK